jgi:GDPmannose 4,6-dehydratase
MAFAEVGIAIRFEGEGIAEKGFIESIDQQKYTAATGLPSFGGAGGGQVVVRVDPEYYRPTEVDVLIGDPTKSKTKLGWKPTYDLASMIKEMVMNDLQIAKNT